MDCLELNIRQRILSDPVATEYLKSANEHVVVMVHIEMKEGMQNAGAIAAADGIDCLFICPYDLALCLGYPPPSPDPHPDVEVIIQDILKTTHKEGKKCAIYCTSGKQSLKRAEEGFNIINVTSDIGAMAESVAANLDAAVGVESIHNHENDSSGTTNSRTFVLLTEQANLIRSPSSLSMARRRSRVKPRRTLIGQKISKSMCHLERWQNFPSKFSIGINSSNLRVLGVVPSICVDSSRENGRA